MRKELELIQLIERYLRNELSKEERQEFEERLKNDLALREEVELQKQTVDGIERLGVKNSIKKGKRKFNQAKAVQLVAGIVILVGIAAYLFSSTINRSISQSNSFELNELGEKMWADADEHLNAQFFTINSNRDTVIESEEGVLLHVPANAFVDENGNALSNVQLEFKEAMTSEQILKAGLSSKSGDKLLESAGMFYVNGRVNGKTVEVNPAKSIYMEVPTDNYNADMQLFSGKRMEDGSIDWIDPVPLENNLTTIDIHALNFYPPGYEARINELKKNPTDKEYKDSLYYSFSWKEASQEDIVAGKLLFNSNCAACHKPNQKFIGPALVGVDKRLPMEWLVPFIQNSAAVLKSGDVYANNLLKEYNGSMMTAQDLNESEIRQIFAYVNTYAVVEEKDSSPNYFVAIDSTSLDIDLAQALNGINPAKIKTIWNEKFNNTLLATKEFEERLQFIFSTCENSILDLYINNLQLNLFEIDEMAKNASFGETREVFQKFADRKNGKVDVDLKRLESLKKYYLKKQKIVAEAAILARSKMREKRNESNEKYSKTIASYSENERKREQDNFIKEFNINLIEAYRQLGRKKPKYYTTKEYYKLSLKRGGWINVDAYVAQSVAKRETMNYTDPKTGKKAILEYKKMTVTVENASSYDRLLVYILPNELKSFIRVKKNGGSFEENLNMLLENNLVCFGYKGDKVFYYRKDLIEPTEYQLSNLEEISEKQLKIELRKFDSKTKKELKKEILFQKELIEYEKQLEEEKNQYEFNRKIQEVIFPCYSTADSTVLARETLLLGSNKNEVSSE